MTMMTSKTKGEETMSKEKEIKAEGATPIPPELIESLIKIGAIVRKQDGSLVCGKPGTYRG